MASAIYFLPDPAIMLRERYKKGPSPIKTAKELRLLVLFLAKAVGNWPESLNLQQPHNSRVFNLAKAGFSLRSKARRHRISHFFGVKKNDWGKIRVLSGCNVPD